MEKKNSIRDFIPEGKANTTKVEFTPAIIPLHKPDIPAKVIVNTSVYHRDSNGKAIQHITRSVRHLNSNDDPIQRKLTIGEQWTKLDTAWIKEYGYLSFRNDGGKPFNVNPTDEQMAEARSRIVEVGYSIPKIVVQDKLITYNERNPRTAFDPPATKETPLLTEEIEAFWLIHPGECMNGKPISSKKIYLRCQHGETTVSVFIIPN